MTGREEILAKARHYCSYQERSVREVRHKLKVWGSKKEDEELIIDKLIEEDFINERRFAREYATGKFRNNGWGSQKIRYELIKKGIPEELIEAALTELDEEEDIEEQILKLLEKKSREIKNAKPYERKQKLIRFAMSRGFKSDKILSVIEANKEQLLKSPH